MQFSSLQWSSSWFSYSLNPIIYQSITFGSHLFNELTKTFHWVIRIYHINQWMNAFFQGWVHSDHILITFPTVLNTWDMLIHSINFHRCLHTSLDLPLSLCFFVSHNAAFFVKQAPYSRFAHVKHIYWWLVNDSTTTSTWK